MYTTVLIATDGSEVATTAANLGLAVAEKLGAEVHVLSVAAVRTGHDDVRRSDAQEYVDAIARTATERGLSVHVQTAVRDGQPHQEILRYATECNADLLVLGTHGRTGLRRWLLGSVATTVIRESRRPVLTSNALTTGPPRQFDTILVATDGRPGGEAAIDHGIELADAYDASVHAVSVVDETISSLPAVLEEFERVGMQATADVEARAAKAGVSTVRVVNRGIPHEAIIEYADERAVDLIVVGTEGRTGLGRLAFGSVSQRIVGKAPVPVLTVRSADSSRAHHSG